MKKQGYPIRNYRNMKALWLSQFDLHPVYCSEDKQRPADEYTRLIKRIMFNVASTGFNTVIVQLRPNADSMYPSDYFPPSAYVVGAYGRPFDYDPVEILIDEAHREGLFVHAWINPLRGVTTAEMAAIDPRYPVSAWFGDSSPAENRVVTVNGRCYLNPACADVHRLIVNGAEEILTKYEVDGLHMDDYFYPTIDSSFDLKEYDAYRTEGGPLNLANFRRERLNRLVSSLYKAVKSVDPALLFGISPAGNINTVFNSQYADVYTWCTSPGYLDYICPQVYFGLEHQTYDFVTVCRTWRSIIRQKDVDLIIGMTLGKAKSRTDRYAGSGKDEWARHTDILRRCLAYTKSLDKCRGVAYFCYQYFFDPVSGNEIPETKQERENFLPLFQKILWNNESEE